MAGNTTNKGLIQPANGSDVDVWDVPVNANSATTDLAFGGLTNLNATGASGNVSLTITQYVPPDIIIGGTPAGNISYQLPGNVGGFWSVFNGTVGNATVGMGSVGGGNSTVLVQGSRTAVVADGNGNVNRWDNAPAAAGGANGQVQFNSGGVMAGSPNLTFTGGNVLGTGVLQLNGSSSGFIQLQASPASTPTVWTWPPADGSLGQVLSTNGSGQLAWVTAAGAGVTTFNGRGGTVTLTSPDVTGALGYVPVNPATDNSFTAGQQTTPVVAPFSATVMAVNCALSNVFTTTFTASVTNAPSINNPGDGQTINWFITQDGSGNRSITGHWPASFKWPGGTKGVLSTAAGAVDLLIGTFRAATGFWYVSLLNNFS